MSRRWRVVLGLAPALSLLAAVLGSALLGSLAQSLGHAPAYGVREFPTLRYYAAVLADPAVAAAAWRTLAVALPATLVAIVVGTALGLAVDARRPVTSAHGRGRVRVRGHAVGRALGRLPLLVPYVVAVALATLWLSPGGLLARLAAAAGLGGDAGALPRLLDGGAAIGAIVALAWKQVPFVAVLVAAARRGGDPDLDDVASVFGAGRWQRLRYVTLPRVAPALVAALALCLAFNLGTLEVPLLLGGGVRDTLAVTAWRAYADVDLTRRPQAMAIAWTLTVGVLVAVASVHALARRWLPGAAR